MKLLHVASSPRRSRSISLQLANHFLESLGEHQPTLSVDELDVWKTDLPPFDGAALDAKYASLSGAAMTSDQEAIWQQIEELGERFRRADLILFSVPMWNFGIPYRLKHLIDVVTQRGILFEFGEVGLRGLLTDVRAIICAARGVAIGPDYPPDDYERQISYLETWCRMVGIRDVDVILSQATLGGPDVAEANVAAARAEASRVAARAARVVPAR